MGCKPSPIGAIVRVYTFERRSVYTDPHNLPVMYGRYVDDAGTVTSDEERANQLFNRVAEDDPDSRLSWEIEFPQTGESFTPFLGTQIRVVPSLKVLPETAEKGDNITQQISPSLQNES